MRSSDPPMSKKVNHEMDEMFGDVRVDSYYWLRDDSRSNPDVLSYLQQENDYADFLMSDTRVMYSEPAKFVAKLRDMKTDDNMLLFKCEFGAGHSSKSGRFEKLQEDAFIFAFIMKALNMVPPISSGEN